MVTMDDGPATLAPAGLSGAGQLYVTTVGATAMLSAWADTSFWYLVLIALALPLSLLALWVGFYAGLAVGFVLGDAPGQSWAVAVVWVAVWTMTAWINAQLVQKVLQRGWRTIAARPREEQDED